ncbi:MAG TPA: DNA mismatch repair protein MutS, partial [Chloroflexota bacterium]|nr:DNA mismatch repair protein MutS [Chloroflexota bacterium]
MSEQLTPARQQYLEIKANYPHALLWYRLGDFYEMFDEDARVASATLRITLTSRQFGKAGRVPMCGVPYHAQARFLARLVRQGFSVAICEQMSQPGRGLVERAVVRVVTPGTISEPEILRAGENNYLAALARRGGTFGLAYVDVTTGEFRVTHTEDEQALLGELDRLQVAECLIDDSNALPQLPVRHMTVGETALWDAIAGGERLRRHLGTRALHIAGCDGRPAPSAAAGAILAYLERTNRTLLPILHTLRPYSIDDAVAIDATTRTMLLGKATGSEREGGMYALLDRTGTAMGARLLARWLRRPLRDPNLLSERLDAIQELVQDGQRRQAARLALRALGDLERLTGRIGQERATPDELLALCATLEALPALLEAVGASRGTLLQAAMVEIDPAPDIAAGIRAAVAEPGAACLIRAGYDPAIDR